MASAPEGMMAHLPPDTDSGPAVNAIVTVFFILSLICVALRAYVRVKVIKSVGLDDYSLLLATGIMIVAVAFVYLSTAAGLGRHAPYLGLAKVSAVVKWNTAYQIANVFGVNFVKISILLFLLRLQNSTAFKYIIWFVMVVMTLVNFATALFLAMQCFPLQKLWEPTIPGTCAPEHSIFLIGYVQSGFSVATDLFCTVSPVVVLWNVQISMARKFAVSGLMSLGLLATICNGLRNVWYGTLKVSDYSYDVVPILIVTALEYFLGVISACLPVIAPSKGRKWWRSQPASSRPYGSTQPSSQRTQHAKRAAATDDEYDIGDHEFERLGSQHSGLSMQPLDGRGKTAIAVSSAHV